MSSITALSTKQTAITSYSKFIGRALWLATEGSFAFYAWMTALMSVFLVGANAWANQVVGGMITTDDR